MNISSILEALMPSSLSSCCVCEIKYKSKCCDETDCCYLDFMFKKKNTDADTDTKIQCCDIINIQRSMHNSITPIQNQQNL